MAEFGDMLAYEYWVVTPKIVWNAYQKIYIPNMVEYSRF